MSIFKTNKFFRVIKHFLLAIPLMFVLGVSLYTIVNPNAKDSYYGDTINEIQESIANDNLYVNNDYFLVNNQYILQAKNLSWIYVSNVKNITLTTPDDYVQTNIDLVNRFRIYYNSNNNIYSLQVYFTGITNSYYINLGSFVNMTFLVSYETDNIDYDNAIYLLEYNDYSYLNNAFEYGMYQFTQVGFGQIDFVSFFNGIFMTNINNVYASFINDYINYYLFVECVYFAPWVLHAFIHFIYDMAELFKGRFNKTKEDD